MRSILVSLVALATFTLTTHANPVVYEGTSGIGKGKHLVFIASDHEYRSEETLPALARILALRLANMDKELLSFKSRLLEAFPEASSIADNMSSKRDHLLHEWSF